MTLENLVSGERLHPEHAKFTATPPASTTFSLLDCFPCPTSHGDEGGRRLRAGFPASPPGRQKASSCPPTVGVADRRTRCPPHPGPQIMIGQHGKTLKFRTLIRVGATDRLRTAEESLCFSELCVCLRFMDKPVVSAFEGQSGTWDCGGVRKRLKTPWGHTLPYTVQNFNSLHLLLHS